MGGPSSRQIGRRRRKPVVMAEGQWFGMGKQQEDAISGWLFPEKLMAVQRGGMVSRQLADNSLDYPKEY